MLCLYMYHLKYGGIYLSIQMRSYTLGNVIEDELHL